MTGILDTILRMSLYGALVGLAALVVSRALNHLRAPKGVALMLWAIAALRLLCPVALSSSLSVMNAAPQPPRIDFKSSYTGNYQTAVQGTPEYDRALAAGAPVQTVMTSEGQQVTAYYYEAKSGDITPAQTAEQAWGPALTVLWAVGAGALVLWGFGSYFLFRRRLQFAMRLSDEIYEVDTIPSPCVVGFLHPRIYLPVGLTEMQQRHTIAHERAHLQHRDHIWKLMSYVVLSVHWFNPVVWLLYRQFQQDLEMACDERVLKALGPSVRADYSESLLALAKKQHLVVPNPIAFSENTTKDRITKVLRYKKPLAAVTVAALVLSLILGTILFAGPVEAAGEETELTQEELNWFRNSFFYGPETPVADGMPPFEQGFANHFLCQSFSCPEELDLSVLFYDGSSGTYQMDQRELDQLIALGADPQSSVVKLDPVQMDGLLQKYTGLGLEQLPSDLDREGYYLESTGCYYLVHGDALLFTCPELESGLRQEDGTVQLRYRFPMAQDAHMLWTLTLRPAEGSYQFVSNLPHGPVPEVTPSEAVWTEPEIATEALPADFQVRRGQDQISVYPFTAEELVDARELVESIVAGFAQETGVLTFEVERIAFDPMLTDWNIRSEMSGAPTPGWAERDYYASRISFAVTYRATYDHEKTFLQDTEHAVLGVHLRRDGAQAPWEYQEGDHGIPVAEYSDRAMDTAELDRMVTLGGLEGRLLGGYQVEEGYWLYLYREATGTVSFLRARQDGTEVLPDELVSLQTF